MSHFTRRTLLRSLALFGVSASGLTKALAQPASKKTLVVVFLRGGVDGLSMVPPVGDPAYATLRPSLRILKPGLAENAALALDPTFGLHPSMSSLLPLYQARQLAVVHAVGQRQASRSHFDAQDFLESGAAGRRLSDGWLSRAGQGLEPSAFRLVALQNGLPTSMVGDAQALAFPSLKAFRIGGSPASTATFESLYEQAVDDALKTSGQDAFDSIAQVKREGLANQPPQHGAVWPKTPLGKRLQDLARLIHADVGLTLAATEMGGFDTHLAEAQVLSVRLKELAEALAAFAQDLGPKLADVTVLTLTEFGRTARENGTRGTDHGTASASLVMGGGVTGGKVYGEWPSLAANALFEGRDLEVTTDLRSVMTECLSSVGVRRQEVFPDFTPGRVGLFS